MVIIGVSVLKSQLSGRVDTELRRRAQAGKVCLGARNRSEVYEDSPARMPAETVRSLLHESRGEY